MTERHLIFDFLKDLAKNNQKEWMDANKKRYLAAKEQVVHLVTEVLGEIGDFDPQVADLEPKKTLFRINRDIRFSKNKNPYKTNFGAFMAVGGKNSGNPGYYLHLEPGHCFLGGGIYQPQSEILAKVRQEIDYQGAELLSIIEDPSFKAVYGEPYGNDRLKTAPKGYPKDHEHLPLLQLKHYVFMKNVSDDQVCSSAFTADLTQYYRTLHPFNQFLARALD